MNEDAGAPSAPRDDLRGALRELLEMLEMTCEGLESQVSRDLLESDQLGLCVDDLARELRKTPPLQRTILTALRELAIAAGASDESVASLLDLATRPAVLGVERRPIETPIGMLECSELTIDGMSVGDLGIFHHDTAAEQHAKLDELEARIAGRDDGRVLLAHCVYCGDRVCGWVSCVVEIDGDDVRWHDFVGDDGVGEPAPRDLGPFAFDRRAYFEVLAQLRAAISLPP